MRGSRSTLIAGPGKSVDLQDVASVARLSITGPASSGGSLTFDLSQRSESDPLIRTTVENDLATISVHCCGDVHEVRIPARPFGNLHIDVAVDNGSVEFFFDSGRQVASYIVWIGPGSASATVRNDRTTAVSVELLNLPNTTDHHGTGAARGSPTGH
jgi:hypothetical protein